MHLAVFATSHDLRTTPGMGIFSFGGKQPILAPIMAPLTLRTTQGWVVLMLLFCSTAVASALMASIAAAPASLGIFAASDWFNLVSIMGYVMGAMALVVSGELADALPHKPKL